MFPATLRQTGATLVAVALTAACASRARATADELCAGEPAAPITITGDFHVVYGDRPTFHLVWNGRSAELRFDSTAGAAADSLLAFARRRVVIAGRAIADTATICVASVVASVVADTGAAP